MIQNLVKTAINWSKCIPKLNQKHINFEEIEEYNSLIETLKNLKI